jgi:hypothetical protein
MLRNILDCNLSLPALYNASRRSIGAQDVADMHGLVLFMPIAIINPQLATAGSKANALNMAVDLARHRPYG